MLSDRKIIALCLNCFQDANHAPFVNALHKAAMKHGWRVMVFASFSKNIAPGTKNTPSVFDLINFKTADALVVSYGGRQPDEGLKQALVRAKEAGKPTVIIGTNWDNEDAVSLTADHTEAFRSLIIHLIQKHQIGSAVLMNGSREGDSHSRMCERVFREVMAEHGLPGDSRSCLYTEYRDSAVYEAAEKLAASGKLPGAVICADDRIARAVCRAFSNLGVRVPEDVIVTGIENEPGDEYFVPSIAACRTDAEQAAAMCMELLEEKTVTGSAGKRLKSSFFPDTSCCGTEHNSVSAEQMRSLISGMTRHEEHMYSWMEELSCAEDWSGLYSALSQIISRFSVLCLNSSVSDVIEGKKRDEADRKEYTVIRSSRSNNDKLSVSRQTIDSIIPDAEAWVTGDRLCVVTQITAGDMVCGRYVLSMDEMNSEKYKIRRVTRTLSTVLGMLLNRGSDGRRAENDAENGFSVRASGLPGLEGAVRWFEAFSALQENHRLQITATVYSMPKYSYIYENYGIFDTEETVQMISEALRRNASGKRGLTAQISQNEFLQIFCLHEDVNAADEAAAAIKNVYKAVERFNAEAGKDYQVEVNSGYTTAAPGWQGTLETFVKLASGEMYKNRMLHGQEQGGHTEHATLEMYSMFNYLVDNNLFTFCFQPIVDAKTGSVYGYEALMRTSGGVKMSPLDVLETARDYHRLYDIEKITLFSIVERYEREFDSFRGRKLFINTIPGNFLNETDSMLLKDKYRTLLDHFVFEITEQDTISDEELGKIKSVSCDGQNGQVAVDDYGTGHSNIANLLRYAPQIIKIDRFLISGIQNDLNKQMFVQNTIEFARLNGIKVLAEGVETFEELQKVIECGVDLIQGYYTAKPAPFPLQNLPAKIKNEIIAENLRISRFDNDLLVYNASSGEKIDIIDLAYKKYAYVNVAEGEVTFTGEKDNTVDLVIRVAEQTDACLIFDNVNIKGSVETTVQIGRGSRVEIVLYGENTLNKEGIHVPETASLLLRGDGSLTINGNRNFAVGIGSNYSEPHGEIDIDINGKLSVISSGDKVVSIGGGRERSAQIQLSHGTVCVDAKGIDVLGIGSVDDCATVRIIDADVRVHCSGNNAVGIGSVKGSVDIETCGTVYTLSDGEKAVGIGTCTGTGGRVKLIRGNVTAVTHCDIGTGIGSVSGSVSVENIGACTDCYGEGTRVRSFGSVTGRCVTRITGGCVRARVQAAEELPFGGEADSVVITGGNVVSDSPVPMAVNDFGEPLIRYSPKGHRFEKNVVCGNGEYVYTAVRDENTGELSVYLPHSAVCGE